MSNRRAEDHPWETRARWAAGLAFVFMLGWSIYSEGLRELSDLKLIVFALLIGACFKLNPNPALKLVDRWRGKVS